MLALICEQVSGKPYHDLINEVFVNRLGMEHVWVVDDYTIVPQSVSGYTTGTNQELSLPLMASVAIAMGTGNLRATPRDVVQLVNLDTLLQNNPFDKLAIEPLKLPDGSLAEFVADNGGWHNRQGYLDGCTFFEFDVPDITVLGKLGVFPGFGTVYFYDRQTQYAIVLSVNNEKKITDAMLMGARILAALRGR